MTLEQWWDENKDSWCWSEELRYVKWSYLSASDNADLKKIFDSARERKSTRVLREGVKEYSGALNDLAKE